MIDVYYRDLLTHEIQKLNAKLVKRDQGVLSFTVSSEIDAYRAAYSYANCNQKCAISYDGWGVWLVTVTHCLRKIEGGLTIPDSQARLNPGADGTP